MHAALHHAAPPHTAPQKLLCLIVAAANPTFDCFVFGLKWVMSAFEKYNMGMLVT
jgi:hypothetical protein